MKHSITFIISIMSCLCCLQAQDTIYATTVVSHEKLDMRYEKLVAIPTLGIFDVVGNELRDVSGQSSAILTFPDWMVIDDIVWTGKEFIVKSYNRLYKMDDLSKSLHSFDDTTFMVFPRDEKSVYLALRHGNSSSIFLFYTKFKTMKRLVSVPGWVVAVAGADKATMVVTDEAAWIFTKDRCVPYMNFNFIINDAVLTNKGLVCASDKNLILVTGPEKYEILARGNFDRVLYDTDNLYLVTGEGDMLKIKKW